MNGKTVTLLATLCGALFGALLTTLLFSFTFYGELKTTSGRTEVLLAQSDMTLQLVRSAVEQMTEHVKSEGHPITIQKLGDHEQRIRDIEKGRR